MKLLLKVNTVLLSAALVACGGGGGGGGEGASPSPNDSSSDDPSPPPIPPASEPRQGVFFDSAVINMDYQTETLTGVTSASGEFEYLDGETVTFSIGDLKFPPISAAEAMTPLDLADTDDVYDDELVNMIRLIQTLDKDGDPSNGIEITEVAKSVATQVDFSLSQDDFESSPAVESLIFNAGQDLPVAGLVSADAAIRHFVGELQNSGFIGNPPEDHPAVIIHANFYTPDSDLYMEVRHGGKRYSSDGYDDATVVGGSCIMSYDYSGDERSWATFRCDHNYIDALEGPDPVDVSSFIVEIKRRRTNSSDELGSEYFDVLGGQHHVWGGGQTSKELCGADGHIFLDGRFEPGDYTGPSGILGACDHFTNPWYGHVEFEE